MALPSSGVITAAMINAELNRSASAPFSLNDSAVRALAGKPSGTIAFSDLRGKSSEIVKYITSSGSGPDVLSALFTSAEWSSATLKRVVVNAGVEIGGNGYGYAIAVAANAGGQANSFAGDLILENRGIISGRGGAAGADGATAVFANLLGRSGNKMQIYNLGTIRGGGGGGGRGGNGGAGGGGYWDNGYWVYDPGDGSWLGDANYIWRVGGLAKLMWGGVEVSGDPGYTATEISPGDGWTYERGAERSSTWAGKTYAIRRRRWQVDRIWTAGGAGGAGGNGGVGQGYGQARTNGAGGAGGVQGGTNAGWGGTGGTGGTGGAWGAAGATGNGGGQGSAGNNGAGAWGPGGSAGGAAGCYIDGNSRVIWLNNGSLQGRAIN